MCIGISYHINMAYNIILYRRRKSFSGLFCLRSPCTDDVRSAEPFYCVDNINIYYIVYTLSIYTLVHIIMRLASTRTDTISMYKRCLLLLLLLLGIILGECRRHSRLIGIFYSVVSYT
jgi:hypothetical protein